jgi:hypothetical protein
MEYNAGTKDVFERKLVNGAKFHDFEIECMLNEITRLQSECNRLQKLHDWIPVTQETMPENYENFFVGGYNFTDHAYFNGDSWVSNTRTDCDGDGEWIIGVTHYQPLPLPPQEQP